MVAVHLSGRRARPMLGLLTWSVRAQFARAVACSAPIAPANLTLLTMGEAMLRLAPMETPASQTGGESRHLPQPFLRSIGGDELNVAVAMSLLGVKARWISVVPNGPMGDVLTDSCAHHGVEFAGQRVDGDVGFFTVLPEKKMVHYQRRNAVFAQHDPGSLDWPSLLSSPTAGAWVHLTGITPLISAQARHSWENALAHATASHLRVSLDLNHRKQLGTLEELWAAVRPHVGSLELLILSVEQLQGLAAIELGEEGEAAGAPATGDGYGGDTVDDYASDTPYLELMRRLHRLWGCRRLALLSLIHI